MQLFTSDRHCKYMIATERDKFKVTALELEDKSERIYFPKNFDTVSYSETTLFFPISTPRCRR